jgi:dihydroneopterin aldolase
VSAGTGAGATPPAEDRIELRGLRCFGRHGVGEAERREGQAFVVDVTVRADLDAPAESDDLADTIDYGALAVRVAEAVRSTRFDLLEALADHLCRLVLDDPRASEVEVRVAKPDAPVTVELDEVAVVRRRARGGPAPERREAGA